MHLLLRNKRLATDLCCPVAGECQGWGQPASVHGLWWIVCALYWRVDAGAPIYAELVHT
jgi:hypothetical protein